MHERRDSGEISSENRLETIRADAYGRDKADGAHALIEMHRAIAQRLLREGAPQRAFSELVRASRAVPMSRRLAAALMAMALKAGTVPAAVALLTRGADEVDSDEKLAVLRSLARLLRKTGQEARAREVLASALSAQPAHARTRALYSVLLEREERWPELDASLEKEVREALRRRALKRATRLLIRQARVKSERLGAFAPAARLFEQAAALATDAGDADSAFVCRLLVLSALHQAVPTPEAWLQAVEAARRAAKAAGQTERFDALVAELEGESPTDSNIEAGARRHSTEELVAVAVQVESKGKTQEMEALLAAAIQEGASAEVLERLEAHYLSRKAWPPLAQLYRDEANRAPTKDGRASILSKLAELLEGRLGETAAAARAWAEVHALTGDKEALRRSRVPAATAKPQAAEGSSSDPRAEADALVRGAEEAWLRQETAQAAKGFRRALEWVSDHPEACAGVAELAAAEGDRSATQRLREVLRPLGRGAKGRAELFRRLARLDDAAASVTDAKSAWREVLSELPTDEEAIHRLYELAELSADPVLTLEVLATRIGREPRDSVVGRKARLERATLLEKLGRLDEAISEMIAAAGFDPDHLEAVNWVTDRLIARGEASRAVRILEAACEALSVSENRRSLLARLERLYLEGIRDDVLAQSVAHEAAQGRDTDEIPVVDGSTVPPQAPAKFPERTPPSRAVRGAMAAPPSSVATISVVPGAVPVIKFARRKPPSRGGATVAQGASAAPRSHDASLHDAPLLGDHRQTQRLKPLGAEGDFEPSFGAAQASPERQALFERVRKNPLEADGYRALAEHFDMAADPDRSALMLEIARALESDPHAAPRAPKLVLGANDRAGLRHPTLRGEAGELLALVGSAVCRLYPAGAMAAGREEVSFDSGKGAKLAADALLTAVRVLGLRAPPIFLAPENGPPFSLVFVDRPRLLVGKLAVKKELPDAELRFFAGRALFSQSPDLMALRSLKREHLQRSIGLVGKVLKGDVQSPETRALKDGLSSSPLTRVKELMVSHGENLDLSALAEGARHSANRAGLVVAGGVAPALSALRAKKALPAELIELVRFAASDRYMKLRGRRLAG